MRTQKEIDRLTDMYGLEWVDYVEEKGKLEGNTPAMWDALLSETFGTIYSAYAKAAAWDAMYEEHQPKDSSIEQVFPDEDTQENYDLREKMDTYLLTLMTLKRSCTNG